MKEETLGRQLTLEANRTILIIRSGRIYSLDIDGIGNGQAYHDAFWTRVKRGHVAEACSEIFLLSTFRNSYFQY